ncbi:MAG: hypothetical protein ABIO39_04965 [Caulobacteraceae bacterium]
MDQGQGMKVKNRKPLNMTALAANESTPAEDAPAATAAVSELLAAPTPLSSAHRSTVPPVKDAPPRRDESLGFARHAYLVAGLAAVAWAGALAAFVAGFQSHYGAFDYAPLQVIALLGLCVLPAIFMGLAAFALRQGAQLAAETRRARTLADEMVLPVALAADHAGGAADSVRREIERIGASAAAAREELLALREVVGAESLGLVASAAEVERSARSLASNLGHEREQLTTIAGVLKGQTDAMVEAFARQSHTVNEAADLAEAQLREAEAALASRAADLSLAASDAGAIALRSARDLAQHSEQLEITGHEVSLRLERLQTGINTEREALSVFAEVLRSDQEDLAARLETGMAQLGEAGTIARSGAYELSEASAVTIETLRNLSTQVADEVRALTEASRREQAAADVQARQAFGQLSDSARQHYDALETRTSEGLTRLTEAAEAAKDVAAGHLEAAADAAGAKLEALGQIAYAVTQQADQTFEDRLTAARTLIEQSSTLVDDAGRQSAERIEAGLAAVREMVGELDHLLAEVEARAAKLPAETDARIDAVREAVTRGVEDLTAAAHKAAEDTQAIDAMFQERVRRNYDVLNEAVQLIGRVAGGVATPTQPPKTAPRAEPAASPPRPAAEPDDIRIDDHLGEAERSRPAAPKAPSAPPPAPVPAPDPAPTASEAGLRPKLKLSATPADTAFKSVFTHSNLAAPKSGQSNGGPLSATPAPRRETQASPEAADEWTWKDLLSSIEEQPLDDESLTEQLISEIEALGLDVGALLPRARIEEIAAALQTGDAAGAREVVRRLAPAAVRRLSRRVLTDKVLRAHADRYVRHYEGLLTNSAHDDREGYQTATLLGSDSGRAFLLLDAAVGDLH